MISNTQKQLFQFWSGFGIPAYIQGDVPNDAEFPYIVYQVEDGDTLQQTVLTAFVYVTGTQTATRREILDKIALAIPYEGKRLQGMVLYRNTAGWLSLGKDDETIDILNGRISYQVNYY